MNECPALALGPLLEGPRGDILSVSRSLSSECCRTQAEVENRRCTSGLRLQFRKRAAPKPSGAALALGWVS